MKKAIPYVVGMLVFGTATAILAKTQFSTKSLGTEECAITTDGGNPTATKMCYFDKPWFETGIMFLGMCLCLPIHFVTKMNFRKFRRRAHLQLNDECENPSNLTWKLSALIMLPALFDLVGTTLSGIGLLWVAASVYQMLRGAEMIFAALLSVRFLKRKLHGYHALALVLSAMALAMVGVASVFSEGSGDGDPKLEGLGIAMIVLGQLVQASQMVMEEHLLCNLSAPPLIIIGMEGLWGVLVTGAALAAAAFTPVSGAVVYAPDGSCEGNCANPIYHENTADTWTKLANSAQLRLVVGIYVAAVVLYNMSGIKVTQHTSAGHRTVIEACRTLCIWLADLFVYYVLAWRGDGSPGEDWDMWSYLELAGFVLLVAGTFIYNRVVELPWFYYPPSMSTASYDIPDGAYIGSVIEENERLLLTESGPMGINIVGRQGSLNDSGMAPGSLPLATTPHN